MRSKSFRQTVISLLFVVFSMLTASSFVYAQEDKPSRRRERARNEKREDVKPEGEKNGRQEQVRPAPERSE